MKTIRIDVTQADIEDSFPSVWCCPVAKALNRILVNKHYSAVYPNKVSI